MNLSLISKNLRKYPILVVSLLIVPLVIVISSMRAPKIQYYQDEQVKLAKRWSDIQTNLQRSEKLQEDYERIEKGIQDVRSRLMKVDQVASNYDFFYMLERNAGVTFEQFSLGIPTDGADLNMGTKNLKHFSAVPCRIGMTGSLNRILKFMDLLDRQDFIIRVDLLNVAKYTTRQENQQNSDVLSAQLRCHVLAAKNE